jgi:hypothetical protein
MQTQCQKETSDNLSRTVLRKGEEAKREKETEQNSNNSSSPFLLFFF